MAYEKAMTSTFSFTPPEWLKPFDGVPKHPDAAASRETLEFTASRLQEQADHLKSLAKCGDLTEATKCHMEFAEQSCSRSFGEATGVVSELGHRGRTDQIRTRHPGERWPERHARLDGHSIGRASPPPMGAPEKRYVLRRDAPGLYMRQP